MKKTLIIFLILILLFPLIIEISYATEEIADSNDINQENDLNIASPVALLCEASTGKIIYDKNSREVRFPASTTKIMTALLTLENCELTEIATVSEHAIQVIPNGYVVANLQAGERISINDLMYALLVKSANESANVLAEHIAGSIESFADMMNKRAAELGCTNTHFVNPNGIHSDDHYTTAYDLFLIAQECMKHEEFRKYVSTTSDTLPVTNKYPTANRSFPTTNDMLKPSSKYYDSDVIGIKTGYTEEAQNCLIAAAQRNEMEFISVILGAGVNTSGLNERFIDTETLFDYAFDNYSEKILLNKNTEIDKAIIKNGTKETKNLSILIGENLSSICKNDFDISTLKPEITLNENLMAPIVIGDKIGEVKYNIEGIEYTLDLIAGSTVYEKKDFVIYFVIAGLILLTSAMILIPKKNNSRKNR